MNNLNNIQNDPQIQQFVNQFVQTPETEGIIGSTYVSACLEGYRERIMEEMKNDLMEYYNKNKITEVELNELIEKYVKKIPDEIMLELYGDIIRFVQELK